MKKEHRDEAVQPTHGIIYKAIGPTGKVYIGQTTESLKERKRKHQYRAHRGDRRSPFHVALLALGFSSFAWEQIDTANSKEELDQKEKHWIAHYKANDPAHGYNGTSGGEHYTATPEHRRKNSEARKGKKLPLATCQKMSLAHKNKGTKPPSWKDKKLTEEHRQKIGIGNKGKIRSPETCKKISITKKKRYAEKEGDPLHLFDTDRHGLQNLFREFDEAMEEAEQPDYGRGLRLVTSGEMA
jgi:group I intron endonuclease